MRSIGEIGETNVGSPHFIEWPENLQGTAECAIGGGNSLALIQ